MSLNALIWLPRLVGFSMISKRPFVHVSFALHGEWLWEQRFLHRWSGWNP
jgi:hypothetical protein